MARIALLPGSFDPPTLGHLWMMERGAELFDTLVVAVGTNPLKRCLLRADVRLALLRVCAAHLPNVRAESYDRRLTVDYAREIGARFVIRGVRTSGDFELEHVLHNLNGAWAPEISTLLLLPPKPLSEVSSTAVKSLLGFAGWEGIVRSWVPPPVFEVLRGLPCA